MDEYLLQIKCTTDFLVALNSLVSDLELTQHTSNGLGFYYDNFVHNLAFLPSGATFDEVHTPLSFHEHRVNFYSQLWPWACHSLNFCCEQWK